MERFTRPTEMYKTKTALPYCDIAFFSVSFAPVAGCATGGSLSLVAQKRGRDEVVRLLVERI
jgi:hypothetical protein